jgi:hypothetical protein
MTSGMIGLLEPVVGDAIAKYGSKYVASMLSSKMGLASKTIKQLTGVWHSATDGNFVGNLANKLGNVVEDIDMNYKFSGGAGDVDIVTKTMNIEVKSGNKMKLTQSLKNAEYAKSQGKSYGLYMPNATKAQVTEASQQGVTVYTTEEALKKAIGN